MARAADWPQRIERDIADIAVVRAEAPGPVAARIDHRETFAAQQFGNGDRFVGGALADRRYDGETAMIERTRIMRGEDAIGKRDVGDVAADRVDAPVEADRRTRQAEPVRRAPLVRPLPVGDVPCRR